MSAPSSWRAGLIPTPILRSVTPDQVGRLLSRPKNRRPKHVPVLVDNLWEWSRPPRFPSRRSSVFGSPTPELAVRFGPQGGVVCQVLLARPFRIAQLEGCPDARYHPDLERLTAMVSEFPDGLLQALETPLASPGVVDAALDNLEPGWKPRLRAAVTVWITARLTIDELPARVDGVGEFFFEASGGYTLLPLDQASVFVHD
jgi:hypothetical protein